MFAASLHAVEAGTADPDYTDPERFFAKTFMTQSLENVLEEVLARLLGQSGRGTPVLRLETPFGGGKTHTMVALYHLARHPEAVEATEAGERLRERLNLRSLPRDIRVAVLDGVALDPLGRTVEGLHIRTLWGELAYRLGGKAFYEAVREKDEARIPPGQAVLADLLRAAQPTLILMDEVMHYLAKARAVKVGDTNLADQSVAFLRELTEAVREVPRAVLILSLPASSLEVPVEDPAQAEALFQSVRKVAGRIELIETPVVGDEVFGVLQRRLFRSSCDERAARRAVSAFLEYYKDFAQFFPEELRSPAYRDRMRQAYPFHPALVDLLVQRWGPHRQFQRTRGALRLLALVLRRLWSQRPGSAYLLQPHHIDLADRHLRAEVVRLLDGAAFEGIVSGDILERARRIDRELGGDYQRERLAEGAATVILLYSIAAGAERVGCNEEELRVALLRPGINPAQVSEALRRLRESLWYLRHRDHRYFFTAKPNLNKVILDFEQEVSEEEVEGALRERVEKAAGAGRGPLEVWIAPNLEGIGEPSRATLVILPWGLEDPEDARAWMRQVIRRTTHRNLLIFLAPEKGHEAAVRAAVRRWRALQQLQRAPTFRELDKEDQAEVWRLVEEKEAEIEGRLSAMYGRLFRPAGEDVEEVRVALKPDRRPWVERVAEALKGSGILVEAEALSPVFLATHFRVKDRPVSLAEIQSALAGAPDMPVVTDPRRAVREAVRAGVEQKAFAVRIGETVYTDPQALPEEALESPNAVLVPIEEVAAPPSPAPAPGPSRLEATFQGRNLYPLRKLLEKIEGQDVTVTVVIEDRTGALARQRGDLEGLLQDYYVSYTWQSEPS